MSEAETMRLKEIQAAEIEVGKAERAWIAAKDEAKNAKDEFDAAVEHLRLIIQQPVLPFE